MINDNPNWITYLSVGFPNEFETGHSSVVKDWNCDCGNYKFSIPADVYSDISERGAVQIFQHQGYLNYPWVSQVKAL